MLISMLSRVLQMRSFHVSCFHVLWHRSQTMWKFVFAHIFMNFFVVDSIWTRECSLFNNEHHRTLILSTNDHWWCQNAVRNPIINATKIAKNNTRVREIHNICWPSCLRSWQGLPLLHVHCAMLRPYVTACTKTSTATTASTASIASKASRATSSTSRARGI